MRAPLALFVMLLAASARLSGQSGPATGAGAGLDYHWQPVGSDTDGDERTYYSSNVAHTPQGSVVTWVKLTYANGVTQLLGRVEYDCRDRWRWLTAIVYDRQGNITESVTDPSFVSQWSSLEPETVGDELQQALCGQRM